MRLVSNTPDDKVLHFETIAVLATTDDGDVDKEKTKELIRLFRPNRDGTLSMLDFVRSVDGVYKVRVFCPYRFVVVGNRISRAMSRPTLASP